MLLFIFGFRIRYKTLGDVAFFCPNCDADRSGLRRSARRWFTMFFVPILPRDDLGELVECSTCHTRYEVGVLAEHPTTADLQRLLGDATRALVAMVVRTGDHDTAEVREAAVATVAPLVEGYDEMTLVADAVGVDPSLAERYTEPLRSGLQVAGKEHLLGRLVRVALTDGTISDGQRRVIERAGRGLGLTAVHVTGVVTSVARETGSPVDAADRPEPPTGDSSGDQPGDGS